MKMLLQRYLSFDGRLARLPFLNRSIYLGIGTAVVSITSVPLFLTDSRLGYRSGVVVLTIALALLVVGIASLTVRRLHDLGWSGYHAVWVATAQAICTFLSYGPLKALILGLPLAAIGVWVSFWPGNLTANRFGEVPQ